MKKEMREQRKQEGYCTTCYVQKPERFGYSTCDKCLTKKAKKSHE